jgi:hypothetical protein
MNNVYIHIYNYKYVYSTIYPFTHQLTLCFYNLAFLNNAVKKMEVQVSLQDPDMSEKSLYKIYKELIQLNSKY